MSTWQPSPKEGEPRPIAESLDRFTRRLGAPTASVMAAVFSRWEEVVGPELAAHAQPESVRSGVLTLTVDDPVWANQLRFMAADILARMQAALATSELREMRVKVRR